MLSDAAILTLQLAVVALIALPLVGLVLGKGRVHVRHGHVRHWAAPEPMRVAAVGPSRLPHLEEQEFVSTRARSPGR